MCIATDYRVLVSLGILIIPEYVKKKMYFENNSKVGTFCKTNNTWLLFFYSVNPNTVLLQSNMYQHSFHCTPGFTSPDLFSEKCVGCRKHEPVEPFTKMPCPQVFAEETAGHCMSFFCLMGEKMPQAAVHSSVSYLHPVYFWESEGPKCWQECRFVPLRHLCVNGV